ncbi:polysaccharide deacetylase family protein [Ochrobactrum daejeonense]|nr:polysaccharide deacetylase family protein [Brucella daejeonensis]
MSLRSLMSSFKYPLIRAGLEAIAFSGAAKLFPAAGGRGIVFTMHHVKPEEAGDRHDPNAILSITPQTLEMAIETALEAGLVPVHLHDLPKLLGEPDGTERFVAFTLDDGYRDNAEFAAPVFARYNVPFTIFITTGFVERERSMWWRTAAALVTGATASDRLRRRMTDVSLKSPGQKQAAFRQLAQFAQRLDEDEAVARIDMAAQAAGIDPLGLVGESVMDGAELRSLAENPLVHLGAHTITHVNLRRVDEVRLAKEITGSADAVERYAGYRPRSFAYPYGWTSAFGAREMKAVADAGFAVGVTTRPGILQPLGSMPVMAIPRVSLNGYFQKKRYIGALVSGLPFRLV